MKTDLFILIKSLSSEESRHASFIIGKMKTPVYKDIFRYMRKAEKYSKEEEKSLINILKRDKRVSKNISHISQKKRILFSVLLKHLCRKNSNELDSGLKIIENLVLEADILKRRGLFQKSLTKINLALDTSDYYQYDIKTLEILFIKRELIINSIEKSGFEKKKTLEIIHERTKTLAKGISNYTRIMEVYNKTYIHLNIKSSDKQIEKQIESEILKLKKELNEKTLSFSPLINYYAIFYHYYKSKKKYNKAHVYCEKMLSVFKEINSKSRKNDEIKREYINRYLSLVSLYINNSIKIKEYDLLAKFIDELKHISEVIPDINVKARIFRIRVDVQLKYNFFLEKYDDIEQVVIPEIKRDLEIYKDQTMLPFLNAIYYNCSLGTFLNNSLEEALEWNDNITNLSQDKANNEVWISAKILEIIIRYEYKDYTYMDNKLKTLYKTKKLGKYKKQIICMYKTLFASNFYTHARAYTRSTVCIIYFSSGYSEIV